MEDAESELAGAFSEYAPHSTVRIVRYAEESVVETEISHSPMDEGDEQHCRGRCEAEEGGGAR